MYRAKGHAASRRWASNFLAGFGPPPPRTCRQAGAGMGRGRVVICAKAGSEIMMAASQRVSLSRCRLLR